jgi:hypothetical protein
MKWLLLSARRAVCLEIIGLCWLHCTSVLKSGSVHPRISPVRTVFSRFLPKELLIGPAVRGLKWMSTEERETLSRTCRAGWSVTYRIWRSISRIAKNSTCSCERLIPYVASTAMIAIVCNGVRRGHCLSLSTASSTPFTPLFNGCMQKYQQHRDLASGLDRLSRVPEGTTPGSIMAEF